jgi:uncharacterized metal-binding protein YceD (DUF177 family)
MKFQMPWSVPVRVEDIPETGRRFEVAADADARAAVAKLAGLRSVPRLEAVLDVIRQDSGLHVTGEVSATVGQTCVVSLEPVENEVVEPIDLLFTPEGAQLGGGETIDDDAPEPLVDGAADLAAVATEFLLLGLDPYPRKPGAKFEAPSAAEAGGGPFDALKALKKGAHGGEL